MSSAIVDKYIGESARLIREMFGYAKEHEPCIIFMDEIDAIGGRRFSEGTSADREIQRTLMELLNQLDGFDYLGKTKIIMATNRPDTLDPALLRAGRLDRKIEIPLPNEVGRLEIMKIHAAGVVTEGEIDFESVVKMSDGLNGADLRNVVTEAYVPVLSPSTPSANTSQWFICNQGLQRRSQPRRFQQGGAQGSRVEEAGGKVGVPKTLDEVVWFLRWRYGIRWLSSMALDFVTIPYGMHRHCMMSPFSLIITSAFALNFCV